MKDLIKIVRFNPEGFKHCCAKCRYEFDNGVMVGDDSPPHRRVYYLCGSCAAEDAEIVLAMLGRK